MILSPRTRRSQPASFTLIEILVVIAIIAVLVSLISAAVMKVIAKGPRLRTEVEIRNMDQALSTLMTNTPSGGKAPFLPSKLVLREDGNYTSGASGATNAALYPITIEVLTVMFGKGAV